MSRLAWLLRLVLLLITAPLAAEQEAQPQAALTFEEHIRPIFKTYCFDCHGGEDEVEGGLDLRLRRLLVKGGESGPVIQPGNPEASFLYRRVRDGEMPPRNKKLSSEQIATLGRWIAAGAPTAREEPKEIGKGIGITEEDRGFWSFQPIRHPDAPKLENDSRVRTPVDAFLLAALQEKDLFFCA